MFSWLGSKFATIILLVLVVWLGAAALDVRSQRERVGRELGDLRNKIAALEDQNESLRRFLEYAKDPVFLEKEARLKLNYKAPDEQVAFVYRNEDVQPASKAEDFQGEKKMLETVKQWLRNIFR